MLLQECIGHVIKSKATYVMEASALHDIRFTFLTPNPAYLALYLYFIVYSINKYCLNQSNLYLSMTCFFIQMKEHYTEGTLHAKTQCWAQGMDGWRPLQTIPQLKWTLMATGQAVLNESDLACLILNMLIKMVEYYPSR